MRRLAELQGSFAAAVRFPPASVAPLDVQPTALAPERRVAVYRNHHRISLTEALGANFSTVRKLIGEAGFQALAGDFIAAAPPSEPRLSHYGAGFPDFLGSDRRLIDLPYLADIARLDWASNVAERAEDIPVFGPSHLQAAQADLAELVLSPHPSLSLIHSAYPLLRIREITVGAPEAEHTVSLAECGVDLMIWRRDHAVACEPLDAADYAFVDKMAGGVSLGIAARDVIPDRLPGLLANYLITGAFTAPA